MFGSKIKHERSAGYESFQGLNRSLINSSQAPRDTSGSFHNFDLQKCRDANIFRCTFSRANGPLVSYDGLAANPVKPHHGKSVKTKSLLQKLTQ